MWEALQSYYGIDSCHDPNICLSQPSTPHQSSNRSYSEPSQTALPEIETSQAPKDAREQTGSAPLHHDTQKSPSAPVDLINQRVSLNVHDITSHGQPTQESTGEADDPQTLATFTRPLAKSCIQRDLPIYLPGNHVSRPDDSLLSSGPVFADSCELVQHYSYPEKPSPQSNLLVQHFSGDWHSAKSPQQPAISPTTLFTSSKSQSDPIDDCSAKRTHTDGKNRDNNTLSDVQDEILHYVDTGNRADIEHTILNSHVDEVSQEPEPTMDGAKSYDTEPDAEIPLKLKDMQIKLLKELELAKEDHACLQKTKTTAIEEMKEELRTANEERVELTKIYIAIIENMKQERKKMEHETKMIINLKDFFFIFFIFFINRTTKHRLHTYIQYK